MSKKRNQTICCRQCAGEGVEECRFCAGTGLFKVGWRFMSGCGCESFQYSGMVLADEAGKCVVLARTLRLYLRLGAFS